MQRRHVDTSSLRDTLYNQMDNRRQAAFNYLQLLPPPPPPPNAGPAQPIVPAAPTTTTIANELVTLTNLRNLYVNSPGMEHLVPGIMGRITRLQNELNNA
jgi:hypothetical protein